MHEKKRIKGDKPSLILIIWQDPELEIINEDTFIPSFGSIVISVADHYFAKAFSIELLVLIIHNNFDQNEKHKLG